MPDTAAGEPKLRLAELVASLSLATDLGLGQPMEWALRSCLLAVRLGESMGLTETELTDTYYLALLRFAGCTAGSHETAALFGGDDVAFNTQMLPRLGGDVRQTQAFVLRRAGTGHSSIGRVRTIGTIMAHGKEIVEEVDRGHCEAAQRLAARVALPQRVQDALWHVFERWDGRGSPNGLNGEAIALPVRIVQVAHDATLAHRLGGVEGVVTILGERAGRGCDPAIAARCREQAARLLVPEDHDAVWEDVLAAEPGGRPYLGGSRLDEATRALADFVDLKSPYLVGHSAGVAALAAEAAVRCGLPEPAVTSVRRAGCLHDLGRVAISSGIWGKPGPLSFGEWERVRLHPYYTERIFARAPGLAALGSLAALHHERLDGSGYHRGLPIAMIPVPARILAAADVYHAMTEPRPHRPALPAEQAAGELRREARAGKLDGEAAAAVLAAAGHRQGTARRAWPCGLSDREVAVIRLIARGQSNPQIAKSLGISPKTAGHHVQHIYDKIAVSSRAGAALFAMQHDLL